MPHSSSVSGTPNPDTLSQGVWEWGMLDNGYWNQCPKSQGIGNLKKGTLSPTLGPKESLQAPSGTAVPPWTWSRPPWAEKTIAGDPGFCLPSWELHARVEKGSRNPLFRAQRSIFGRSFIWWRQWSVTWEGLSWLQGLIPAGHIAAMDFFPWSAAHQRCQPCRSSRAGAVKHWALHGVGRCKGSWGLRLLFGYWGHSLGTAHCHTTL